MAGLVLDPWEEFVLANALGLREDGKWAAPEVGVEVSRQNGKGTLLEARSLVGLFLLEEPLVTHSAHLFDTSLEAFRRLLMLIEATPDFDRRVKRVARSHGEEGIELKGGARIRFRTRTKGGGRGFTGDCLILDEAMILPEATLGALLPTLSARPNPQVWYTGSAVDQQIHEHGRVFARVRERGHAGSPALGWFEWSEPYDSPDDVPVEVMDDPEAWARANPAMGIRITAEHVAMERRSMDPRTFAVERLGVGDWPAGDGSAQVIDAEAWADLKDARSQPEGAVCLAFDVTPDRSSASISIAGRRADGAAHIEVVEHRRGTDWVSGRVGEINQRHSVIGVLYDAAAPAAALVPDMKLHGLLPQPVNAREYTQGYGMVVDGVNDRTLRHLGQPELDAAVKGAAKRSLGDAWAWSRKNSGVDISPLVACTLALWGSVDGGAMLSGGFEW